MMAASLMLTTADMDYDSLNNIVEDFIALEKDLVFRLTSENFGIKFREIVEYIYNPLEYASNLHMEYLEKFCNTTKKVLFLGMNPGPWGMCQTGIPFGEINAVRDFLEIEGDVSKPAKTHPLRPILGLNCTRSEISGKRLWSLIRHLSNNDPWKFFKNCALHNYCPLAFLLKSGKNITPDELKSTNKKVLFSICDEFLYKVLKLLDVETVVAIGKFAEKRTLETLKAYKDDSIRVVAIQHPSPRNKASNTNWQENVIKCLTESDVIKYFD